MKTRSKSAAWSTALANAEANPAVRIVRSTFRKKLPATFVEPKAAVEESTSKRRSKTESRYEERLIADGHEPKYESIRLKIELPTGRHDYKPDFLIVVDGIPELHEVKGGYYRERDWMRFEMAVAQWNWLFTFAWVQWREGQWHEKRFPRGSK